MSACLTVGLATAWSTSAAAATVHLSVTPTETISNAFAVYYVLNVSSGYQFFRARALGTIPGGETREFDHDFPSVSLEILLQDIATWNGYGRPGYGIIGLHDEAGGQGLTLGFPNNEPVVSGATYDSLLEPILVQFSPLFAAESNVVDYLLAKGYPPEDLDSLVPIRNGTIVDILRDLVRTPFGKQATLINFSGATFAGTAIATVPEPATWAILVTGAGLLVLATRRRAE